MKRKKPKTKRSSNNEQEGSKYFNFFKLFTKEQRENSTKRIILFRFAVFYFSFTEREEFFSR